MDHNVRTLNGAETFHGMGIISMPSPSTVFTCNKISINPVPRIERQKTEAIVKSRRIPLLWYQEQTNTVLELLLFKSLKELQW